MASIQGVEKFGPLAGKAFSKLEKKALDFFVDYCVEFTLKVNNKDIRTTTISLLKPSENLWFSDDFSGNIGVVLVSLLLTINTFTTTLSTLI